MRPTTRWRALGPVWRFGIRFQALHGTTIAREQGFNAVLGLVAGTHALGLWSFVSRLLLLPTMFLEALWRVSYPAVSAREKAGEDVAIAVTRASELCALVLAWLIVPILVLAPSAVPLLFGSRWQEAVPALFAAAASFLVLGPVSTAGLAALMLRDLAGTVAKAVIASGVLSLVIVFALGGVSLVAAGCAVAAGALLEALLLEHAIRRTFGVSALLPTIAPTMCVLVATATGVGIGQVLGGNAVSGLIGLAAGMLILGTFTMLQMAGTVRAGWALARGAA